MNLDGYLRIYEQRTRGQEKNIEMTLDYTLYTNDTHLFHLSFFHGEEGDH